jgi:hypothetical protein
MARSGYFQQHCGCGAGRAEEGRPVISVMFQVCSIGVNPRRRAHARTVYISQNCLSNLHKAQARQLRRKITFEIMAAGREVMADLVTSPAEPPARKPARAAKPKRRRPRQKPAKRVKNAVSRKV